VDQPWYRKLFSRDQKPDLNATRVKADGGDSDAQCALGVEYGTAQGTAQDFAQAAYWYRKAAEQNHALAQFNLGILFAKGQGVPQDETVAVTWIRKAAEGGDAGAQHHLGVRCHRASFDSLQADVAEFQIEAYKWLRLAADQGYQGSDAACESVTLVMTRDQVAQGNRRATTFVSGKPANGQTD